jgi:hypothetical protein
MSVKELDLFHSSLVFKMGNVSLLFFHPTCRSDDTADVRITAIAILCI